MAYFALIPLLPALAFVLLAPMSRTLRRSARFVSVAAMAASLVLSVPAFLATLPGGEGAGPIWHVHASIVPSGVIGFGLQVDPRSAIMLVVVTIVGTCVQVYSLSYMSEDEHIGWYYAVLSLFSAAMLVVVMADNFLELYMAWEVMGLCSYLLIGFWHREEEPRKASLKAFLTTRVGDVGFAIGLAVMYSLTRSFDFTVVLPAAATWAPGFATLVALLLLFGAMGKSAQFPLHVWLPDAMAGPTPASALIHAATMVAAGVYLVIRAMPIFVASGTALTVTLVIGLITALLGGVLGVVQYDIKKVLAYSTISQLGFMFIALGAGGEGQALWHLTTHAFFKSLLFLAAGSLIHATHTQDMREMGGLARKMPWTTAVFTIGALALAGIVPLSGFFSKDEILAVLLREGHPVAFGLTLLAAAITAFYMTRLWVRVFLGEPVKAHESDALMLSPMALLAGLTVVIGALTPAAFGFLGHEGEWPSLVMLTVSTAAALAGIGVGWYVYGMRRVDTEAVRDRLGFVYVALTEKLYVDAFYDAVFIRPFFRLCDAMAVFDGSVIDGAVNGVSRLWVRTASRGRSFDINAIDGLVNGVAGWIVAAGSRLRRVQTGRVQSYQKLILGALLFLVAVLVLLKGA